MKRRIPPKNRVPSKANGEGMALLAPLPCFIPSSLSGTIHNKNIVRKMDITDLVIIDEAAQALEDVNSFPRTSAPIPIALQSCWFR